MGRFRAPTLRNIAVTAPYMHDGSVATLDAAIDHYAVGRQARPFRSDRVRGFLLTPGDKADLRRLPREPDRSAVSDESGVCRARGRRVTSGQNGPRTSKRAWGSRNVAMTMHELMPLHERPIGDSSDLPLDPYYRFLTASRPAAAARADQGLGALTVSLMAHAGLLVLVALVVGPSAPAPQATTRAAVSVPLVWTPVAGGNGQRGGGGEEAAEAARAAQVVGRESIVMPVAVPPRLEPQRLTQTPDPPPRLDLPAMPIDPACRSSSAPLQRCGPSDCRREDQVSDRAPMVDAGRASAVETAAGSATATATVWAPKGA